MEEGRREAAAEGVDPDQLEQDPGRAAETGHAELDGHCLGEHHVLGAGQVPARQRRAPACGVIALMYMSAPISSAATTPVRGWISKCQWKS